MAHYKYKQAIFGGTINRQSWWQLRKEKKIKQIINRWQLQDFYMPVAFGLRRTEILVKFKQQKLNF
jgi:hypothetical protein